MINNAINLAVSIQQQSFRYIRSTRAFHIGICTSTGNVPDVLFGDQSPIKEVTDLNSGQRKGWKSGAQVLAMMSNGNPNTTTIIGVSPYYVGDLDEIGD